MDLSKVVVFQTGNEQYGVPIQSVISIEKMETATPIPNMPEYMVGVVKVRGDLIPVFDVGLILYNKHVVETEKTRMVVVNTETLSFGLVVDDAKEIVDVPESDIKQVNMIAYQKTSYFVGVANLQNRLVTLIDPNELCESLDGIKHIKANIHSHQ